MASIANFCLAPKVAAARHGRFAGSRVSKVRLPASDVRATWLSDRPSACAKRARTGDAAAWSARASAPRASDGVATRANSGASASRARKRSRCPADARLRARARACRTLATDASAITVTPLSRSPPLPTPSLPLSSDSGHQRRCGVHAAEGQAARVVRGGQGARSRLPSSAALSDPRGPGVRSRTVSFPPSSARSGETLKPQPARSDSHLAPPPVRFPSRFPPPRCTATARR